MKPIEEARIAVNSTKRRLSGGQNVVRGGSVCGWSGVSAAVIAPDHRFPAASRPASSGAEPADQPRAYSTNSTVTPGFTSLASSAASQLVSRTQPWLSVLPIFDGSGVPWMP